MAINMIFGDKSIDILWAFINNQSHTRINLKSHNSADWTLTSLMQLYPTHPYLWNEFNNCFYLASKGKIINHNRISKFSCIYMGKTRLSRTYSIREISPFKISYGRPD